MTISNSLEVDLSNTKLGRPDFDAKSLSKNVGRGGLAVGLMKEFNSKQLMRGSS